MESPLCAAAALTTLEETLGVPVTGQFDLIAGTSVDTLLHGSHPSLIGPLIEEAKAHIAQGGRKACLTFAVSKYWSKAAANVPVQNWRRTCGPKRRSKFEMVSAQHEPRPLTWAEK